MGHVENGLKALRARGYSFRMLGAHLRANEIPSAQGWPRLLEKHKHDPGDTAVTTRWCAVLSDILNGSVRYGDRSVSVYEFPDRSVVDLAALTVQSRVDPNSLYATAFPVPLSQPLLGTLSSDPVFTKVEQFGSGSVRLLACVKRFVRSREEISVGDLPDGLRAQFSDFQEVIGVRCGYVQGVDAIVIHPSAKRIEIHIDHCCPLNTDELILARRRYVVQLQRWLAEARGVPEVLLPTPRNWFPSIQPLYNSPDGKVTNLGHSTASASVKDERMRRRTDDLRQEPFHVGGLAGVQNATNLYSITKAWTGASDVKTSPAVTIPGHFSMVGSQSPNIDFVMLTGCDSSSDFDLLMSKLL